MVAALLRGFNYLYKVSVYQIKFHWNQASCPIGTIHVSYTISTLNLSNIHDFNFPIHFKIICEQYLETIIKIGQFKQKDEQIHIIIRDFNPSG